MGGEVLSQFQSSVLIPKILLNLDRPQLWTSPTPPCPSVLLFWLLIQGLAQAFLKLAMFLRIALNS